MVGERMPGGSLPDDPHDAEGFPLMTHEVVARMARERDGYMLPEVNDILWLSDKRWRAVAGLDAFTGVTILHLENNRIGPTLGDGLQAMRKLAVLHLSGNSLTSVDDARLARRHPSLVSVSLASNRISRVSNDAFPNSLRTLSLAKNRLRDASAIEALSRLPDLETLDLGENELRDEDEEVLRVLAECPSLRVLTLRGNPLVHSLGLDYRRALVSALPRLTCLDDKAVSAMERLGAEAWRRGGKSKQAEKEAKESLVFARDERRRAATRAAAAERAERRAKAEARQAEERDVAGASDEQSNSGEGSSSHLEDVSAPRASELTEKARDPIAAAAASAAAAVAEGDRRLAEEAKARRRAFALAAARGEEVTFAPSPVEMSVEATQQTLRLELSKLGFVSGDETSSQYESEAAARAAALFREMVEARRAQRA